jgi:uncharacterized coiled-coil protein SlyX
MTDHGAVTQMEARIARSRERIAVQEAAIAKLAREGSGARTNEAVTRLISMKAQLADELDILKNMRDESDASG